jgi:hypothetical protein
MRHTGQILSAKCMADVADWPRRLYFIARPVRAAGSLDTLSDAKHGKVMDVHADAANSRYRFYFIEGFDWPNRCRRTIKGTSILST